MRILSTEESRYFNKEKKTTGNIKIQKILFGHAMTKEAKISGLDGKL